jgi:hypothetical protein
MKQRSSNRRSGSVAVALIACAVAALVPRWADAAECPSSPDDRERRALAREWFGEAEAKAASGDDSAAIKAYTCSFEMIPHPSTAYRMARAAERIGDLQLALTAHRDYLTLKPDAADRSEVEARIITIQGRIAAGTVGAPLPALQTAPAPPPFGSPEGETRTSGLAGLVRRMGTTEWVILGVGAATLVSGVVFNIGARSQMTDCRNMALAHNITGARDACNRAAPFAYTSYALLGTAVGAAVAEVILLWTKSAPSASLALVPLPGGAAMTASATF